MRARTISLRFDGLPNGGSITVYLSRDTGNYFLEGIELTPDDLRRLAKEMLAMHLSNLPELWEGEEPTPKATAPDRPSNVGQLRPTVELPDLTLDDDLPF